MDALQVAALVASFRDEQDQAAEKSRELVLNLLQHTAAPFSRRQFKPGHITCTGLVLDPEHKMFLLVHHRRLDRWLLPGGHVERKDSEIWETARREVSEETGAKLEPSSRSVLVGIDVHGIPPGRGEPFHLHHDLMFGFQAISTEVFPTKEVRSVAWCEVADWQRYNVPASIRLSALRALTLLSHAVEPR